jgi:uncharacterized protein (TIGR00369 family)
VQPQNPDYRQRVQKIFDDANFIQDLGIKVTTLEPGICETELVIQPKHLQQDGFVHAGVQATLADHTSGSAAGSLMAADEVVLTIEFKINLLRPCIGQKLRCRAQVLRAGRTVTVSESEVFAVDNGKEKLCAKATVTLALVKQNTVS